VTAADLAREPISNTAAVSGRMAPAPDYPEGTTVSDQSTAVVTIEDLPLSGISISKNVQNVTRGGSAAALAGGFAGDVFRYTVTITNNGEVDLTQVSLTDDHAVVGGAVRNTTAGTDLTWTAGTGGIATIDVGILPAGGSVTFTYEYTSTADDISVVLVNTATAQGTFQIGQFDPQVISVQGSASIAIDQIPITSETEGVSLAGLGLLVAAAALIVFRKRRNRHDDSQDSTLDKM
jgi:LPXTG-motif cell wall-anchored protein